MANGEVNKSIYLAGPITPENDWREQLVDRSQLHAYDIGDCYSPDKLIHPYKPLIPDKTWPVLKKAIFGLFDYTGPYFIDCCHGCHPDTHGIASISTIREQDGRNEYRELTLQLSVRAISRSARVFAWIDKESAYGTIAEIGYAAAKGIPVYIAGPRYFEDMWFVYQMADKTTFDYGIDSIEKAFMHLLSIKKQYVMS